MQLPAELARAVEEEAAEFPLRELARAAASISDRYRSDRPRTGRLSRAECAAWVAVRMPATWAAMHAVLHEVRRLDPDGTVQSVLDLGAGPGAGIRAACEVFPFINRATAMEHERSLIAVGERLAKTSEQEAVRKTKWLERDICIGPPFPVHDLVLLAWVAGELDSPAREAALERAWQAAGYGLVIIEPGTPRGFDIVRRARQQLILGGAYLAAPCPSGGDCGAPKGQWCHFAARVERSSLHRRLKGGELSYEDEKFSYVVATRAPVRRAPGRIVRHPQHEPGLIRLEVCTGEAWNKVDVRKRDAERFRRARKGRWGDEWIENAEIQI
jgi:ribosomal protein RSM22 (predicted rRNA methylase)